MEPGHSVRDTVIQTVNDYNQLLILYTSNGPYVCRPLVGLAVYSVMAFLVFYLVGLFKDVFSSIAAAIVFTLFMQSSNLASRSSPREIFEKTQAAAFYAARMKEKPIRLLPLYDDPNFLEDISFMGHTNYERNLDGVIKAISKLKTLSIEFWAKKEASEESIQ